MADGVSSWQRYGVNPALFAWELMVRCEEAAVKHAGKLEVGMLENYGKQTNKQGFSLLLETPKVRESTGHQRSDFCMDIVVEMFQRSRCLPKVRNDCTHKYCDGMSEHCKPPSLSAFRGPKYLDGKKGFLK